MSDDEYGKAVATAASTPERPDPGRRTEAPRSGCVIVAVVVSLAFVAGATVMFVIDHVTFMVS